MLACPRCGELNPERAKFCLNCGTSLADRAASREMRKIVTVVFCDLAGSTSLGERLDPESLRRVISRYFDRMRSAIERHGGTVEKFIGDAVMAVFGVPEAHEDDALRALVAARDMQAELAELNGELSQRWAVLLQCRIGVNTGEVLTGDAGAGQALVTGDTVNVAARFEQTAEPGQVLIGRTTYQLTRDAVRAEPVPSLHLKGKESAVPAYELLEVFPSSPARIRRLDVPLVGRQRELRAIEEAYVRCADERSCHLVTIVGEAGVGKTRLVAEAVTPLYEQATVIAGTCPEYGEGMTFWPAADAVREAAGLAASATRELAVGQLRTVLGPGDHTVAATERLVELIGLGTDGDGSPAPVDELAWAVRKLFEAVARDSPLVVVFEDLHWAEPTFLDLVDHLVTWSRQAPILVVCVGRPELLDQRPWWAERRPTTTPVRLTPLTAPEAALLLRHLLGGDAVAEVAREWVTGAAEGNPLFVEETLAMLLDEGALEQRDGAWVPAADLSSVRMPKSLESLLVARIDQLDPLDENVLLRSSVVGKVFGTAALSALSPPTDRPDLPHAIARLSRRDLIEPEPSGFLGGEAFAFHHALLRDAAYEMLTKEQRADLHERFAVWLERAAGEWAVEYEELLAYHLEAAYGFRQAVGLVDEHALDVGRRAATKLLAAGRRALAREDVPAAARLLSRARDLLEAAGDAPGVSRAEALHELGRALMAAGRLSEASTVLSDAASVAPQGGRLHLEIGMTCLTLELQTNPSASLDAAAEAAADYVREFERLNDDAGLAHAWHLVASIEWIRSQVAASEEALSRAVTYARRAGDDQEEATLLGNLTGVALFGLTPVDAGIRRCEDALETARAGQRRILEGRALRALAGMRAMQGDIASARELVGRSVALFDDLGQPLWTAGALQVLGIVERLAGNADAAEKAFRESYALLEREGDTSHLSFAAALLARALFDLRRDDEAMTMTEVSERTGAPDDFDTQMQWRAVRAKLLARDGRVEDAVVLAEEAERTGRRTQLHFFADVLIDVGEVLLTAGHREEAAAAMREALAMYESKGNIPSAALAEQRLLALAS